MPGAPAHRFLASGPTRAPAHAPLVRGRGGEAGRSRGRASPPALDAWSVAWTLAIVALALAATLTMALNLPDRVRLVTAVPFALLGPGMAFARLRRLGSRVAEVALGLALGVAIASLVAGALLALGLLDPSRVVAALVLATLVALELDPRLPGRRLVWRELWTAARGAIVPADPRPAASPSARGVEALPPPPVAVVRRNPHRAPVAVQPAKPKGRRPALGEDPLESPAISRHLRSTIDGVIDDLAARKDVRSP